MVAKNSWIERKQRYFRRKVGDAVLSTQLKNDHLHEQLLEELDKNSLPSPKEDDLAATVESRTKKQRSGLAAVISQTIQRVDEPFKGKYTFVNKMANRCQDFDLQEVDDEKEVDKYLTEFVLMKHKYANNDKLLQFTDYRNNKVLTYAKNPSAEY